MGDKESTVRARELGAALRKAMQAAGLENRQVARKLGWSESKISNIFTAKRGASETDIASLLGLLGIGGAERERLLRLTRESHEIGWWQKYGERLPPQLLTLIEHENSATRITEYQPTLIPGLLQADAYIRALIGVSATIPAAETEERVRARLRRQEIFNRLYPAQFRFFIDEYAVLRPGMAQEIVSEQVHHLLRLTVRPYVDIRIIPGSVGIHGGFDGPFVMMEFAEIKPVVHIENATSSLFVEQRESTRAYQAILKALAGVALDREHSREWISRLASELGGPSEGAT